MPLHKGSSGKEGFSYKGTFEQEPPRTVGKPRWYLGKQEEEHFREKWGYYWECKLIVRSPVYPKWGKETL